MIDSRIWENRVRSSWCWLAARPKVCLSILGLAYILSLKTLSVEWDVNLILFNIIVGALLVC